MPNIDSIAQALFGGRRVEEQTVETDATTRTYIGVATSGSEEGTVSVDLDGDVTTPDDLVDENGNPVDEYSGAGVEIATSPYVEEGDEVMVTLVGGGPLKTPMVTAVAGAGDRTMNVARAANTIAEAAQAVADAVNQHFWADTSGIHVTEVTQEAWQAAQTGANVLINSIGQLFRNGTNNLLAIVAGSDPGVAIYDGGGNAASNIITRILGSGIQIGRDADVHVNVDGNSIDVVKNDTELITMRESDYAGFVGQMLDASETTEPYCSGMTVAGESYSASMILSVNTTDKFSDINIENLNSRTIMNVNGVDEISINDTIAIEYPDPYDSENMLRLGMPAHYQHSGSYRIATAGIDTYTNGPRVTLPAGSYIIVGAWIFQAGSSSGQRNLQLGFRSGASGSLWGERERIMAAANNYAILNVSALRTLTSETTVYLAGSSSMTTATNGDAWITAVHLN